MPAGCQSPSAEPAFVASLELPSPAIYAADLRQALRPLILRLTRQYAPRDCDRDSFERRLDSRLAELLAGDTVRAALVPHLIRQLTLFACSQSSARCVALDGGPHSLPALIAALPEPERQAIVWRFYGRRSIRDISEMLDLTPARTRACLNQAASRLAHALRT